MKSRRITPTIAPVTRLSLRRGLTHCLSIAGLLGVLLMTAAPAVADPQPPPAPLVLYLSGIYQPVVNGPNLGLSGINLNDGTWITTQIHSVTTAPGSPNQKSSIVGNFYSQVTSALVAYQLPGGAILMQFTGGNWGTPIPDGGTGFYYQETWELTIAQATGIYSQYVGGHNHMVDRFHSLNGDFLTNPNAGPFDESCFCIISVEGSLPLWWSSN